jgi:uncharacterized protein
MPAAHLLDANALIALCWPAHEHHARVRTWFKHNAQHGWASNALTQGAFMRIVLQPAFSGRQAAGGLAVADVAELLLRNTAHPQHRLAALDFGFEQVLATCTGGLQGHRQITDAWLLSCAVHHGMKLLTLDTGLPALLATQGERAAHTTLL